MSFRWRVGFVLLSILWAGGSPSSAQEITASKQLGDSFAIACATDPLDSSSAPKNDPICTCRKRQNYDDKRKPVDQPSCLSPAQRLTKLIDEDTTEALNRYLDLLASFPEADPTIVAALRGKHLRFVWTEVKPDGSIVARQIIRQRGARPSGVPTLPGVSADGTGASDLFDVLVDFDPDPSVGTYAPAKLRSRYTSEKVPNPLLTQIPAFVKQLGFMDYMSASQAGAVKGPAFLVGPRGEQVPPPPPVAPEPGRTIFTVMAPNLPERRANVAVSDFIVRPVAVEDVRDEADSLKARLRLSEGRQSACAAKLADASAAAVAEATKKTGDKQPCQLSGRYADDPAACRAAIEEALKAANMSIVPSCPPDSGSIGHDPVGAVKQAFDELTSTLGFQTAKGESSFHNVPRDPVSFGLMTALRVGTTSFSDSRVAVGDNQIVKVDPLPQILTAVIANWHPFGYDPEKLVTIRDRGSVRLFGGTSLTPDFGLTTGAGYTPIKGLGLNVGYVWFFINTPRSDKVVIGSPVPDDLKSDPFKRGTAGTWYWGFSYSFQ